MNAPIGPNHPYWPMTFEISYARCERPDSAPGARDGRYFDSLARVIMLRNRPDCVDPDESFSVALCDTGEIIATDDDQRSAIYSASYVLMDRSRSAAK